MATPTLSKEAEERVIDAVRRVVGHVDNDGMTPTDAMAKVAAAEKWAADMIRFASHAYNTGRQTAQREASSTALDKFASFPLVDPDAVIARVYGAPKQAQDAGSVSAEYQAPPSWLHRTVRPAGRIKAASADAAPAAPAPTFTQLFHAHARLKRAAEQARHESAVTYERLLHAMGDLRSYFRKSALDRAPFAAAELGARAWYGEGGAALMDWVYKAAALRESRYDEKTATYVTPVNHAHAPWNLIKACIDGAAAVRTKRAAHEAAVAAVEKAGQALHPFTRPAASEPTLAGTSLLDEKRADAGQLIAGAAVGTGTQELLARALRGESKEDRVQDAWQDLEDPAHDAQLRQIRTQALLHDMMNDEVIGSYDPDQVAKAFNEISSMAPRAAAQPLALRASLRRHLQSNLEPFEARELAGLEKDVKQTASIMPEFDTSAGKPGSPDGKANLFG